MDLTHLRTATRAEHEATEAVLPLTSPGLTLAAYTHTLLRFDRVMRAWDAWSAANAPEHLRPLLPPRLRAPLLQQDLAALHERSLPDTPVLALTLTGEPAQREATFLGALYVVEGSTLGGQYIAKHLHDQLGLTPATGAAFFNGHGAETGRLWNEVKAHLVAVADADAENVIQAARVTFAFFRSQLAETP